MLLLLPFHPNEKKDHKGKHGSDIFIREMHLSLFQLLTLCIVLASFDDKQEYHPSSKNVITCCLLLYFSHSHDT